MDDVYKNNAPREFPTLKPNRKSRRKKPSGWRR